MNRKFITGFVALSVVCLTASLGAQNPNYTLSMGSGGATPGGTVVIDAEFSSLAAGGPVAGWSQGVCNGADVSPTAVGLGDCATVKNGSAADFNERATFPGGWTQGVVICFTGCATIAAGTGGFVTADVTYSVSPAAVAPGTAALDFCDTLGTPPVATVVVVAGASITPTTTSGAIDILTDPCAGSSFSYLAPNAGPVPYPAPAGIGGLLFNASFSVADNSVAPPSNCPPDVTQGFSMGCSNDPAVMSPTAVATTLPFSPDFAEDGIFPNGWTIGVVYSFTGAQTLTFPAPAGVISVTYQGAAGALAGLAGPSSTPLTWDSGLGNPPVANVMVVGGGSFAADLVNGSVGFNGTTTQPFVGGDCNGDGINNIADIIWLLYQLFLQGANRNCDFACDANGDGNLDAADAVYNAAYIFQGGPPPAGPAGGACADVPGQTPEDCEQDNCT